MLVHNKFVAEYDIAQVEDGFEGMLAVKFTNKQTDYSVCIVSCYLPPEHSKYGREPDVFFEHLLQITYQFDSCDDLFICGDLNSRIGELQDYIQEIDEIEPRKGIDLVTNKHGESMINFTREAKVAVINGRITTDEDDYTSITIKGYSVVDYAITGYESLHKVSRCRIIAVSDLTDSLGIAAETKISDHSIVEFEYVPYDTDVVHSQANYTQVAPPPSYAGDKPKAQPHFRVKAVPDEFMNRAESIAKCELLIDELINLRKKQEEVDKWYNHFTTAFQEEMKEFFKEVKDSKQAKKNLKFLVKPWWNDSLAELNKTVHKYEKLTRQLKKSKKTLEKFTSRFHTSSESL